MKKLLPLAILLVLSAAACRKESAPVPRRYAFPRVEPYDTAMVSARLGNVTFDVNAQADTVLPRPGWLNISYPRYGVTLHMSENTFSSPDSLQRALRNRRQRIDLNFGDTHGRAETFTTPRGFECMIVGNPEAGSAPVHFIATRDNDLLSGAAVFAGSTRPVDSIAPVYQAVYGDIVRLLLSLQ